MQTESQESRREENAPYWVKAVVLMLVAATVVVIAVNASTTCICEDEANGYFLARKPMAELLQAMSSNVHEDPPLYDVILHGWIRIFDYHVPALRSLSIVFWALMLPGLFLVTRRLADNRTAWIAVAIACLLPSHWLFPGTMRWYSLYSCLSVWNFYFFLGIFKTRKQDVPEERPVRYWARWVLPYAVTGAALWYTNYSAPVLFFSHLVVALIGAQDRKRVVTGLVAGWILVSFLYLPWLPTFLAQMGVSVRTFSPVSSVVAVWVMAAGEFVSPLNPWVAASAGATGLLLGILLLGNLRHCWIPTVILAVVLAIMIGTGVIGSRRVMFLVPLLAVIFAIALQRREFAPRWTLVARAGLLMFAGVVVATSLVQMVRRESWVTYRWLDPIELAVQRIEQRDPEATVLTNSNPALFYLHDEHGKAAFSQPPDRRLRFSGLYFPFADHLLPHYQPRLEDGQTAVYLHHWAYGGPLSRSYDDIVKQMAEYGYEPENTEAFLPMPSQYMKRHPFGRNSNGDWTDPYRVVLLYFHKTGGNELPEEVTYTAQVPSTKSLK